MVKLAYYNIVLSKREIVKRLEEIVDIEIVNKGVIKIGLDTTKYYIRITFDDKSNFLFGDSVNFFSIQEKYKFLIASKSLYLMSLLEILLLMKLLIILLLAKKIKMNK